MNITLNGQQTTLTEAETTVSALLHQRYADMLVAVAINNNFVPKSQHDTTTLNPDDQIDIVAPMQGG